MDIDWANTKTVLVDLQNLLCCGVCDQLVQSPRTLGGCEHFFCRECIEKCMGNECPLCGIPSHVKDVQMNRQLSTAVSLCRQLGRLLDTPQLQQQNQSHHLQQQQGKDIDCCGDGSGRAGRQAVESVLVPVTAAPEAVRPTKACLRRGGKVQGRGSSSSANTSTSTAPPRKRKRIPAKVRRRMVQVSNHVWHIGSEVDKLKKCNSCTRPSLHAQLDEGTVPRRVNFFEEDPETEENGNNTEQNVPVESGTEDCEAGSVFVTDTKDKSDCCLDENEAIFFEEKTNQQKKGVGSILNTSAEIPENGDIVGLVDSNASLARPQMKKNVRNAMKKSAYHATKNAHFDSNDGDDEDILSDQQQQVEEQQQQPWLLSPLAKKPIGENISLGNEKVASSPAVNHLANKKTTAAGRGGKYPSPAGKGKEHLTAAGKAAKHSSPAGKATKNSCPAGKAAKHSSPAGKAAKHSSPAGKAAKHSSPAGKAAKHSSPAGKAAKHSSPAGKAAKHSSPAGKAAKHSSPAGKAAKHSSPAGKAAKLLSPAGRGVKSSMTRGKRSSLGAQLSAELCRKSPNTSVCSPLQWQLSPGGCGRAVGVSPRLTSSFSASPASLSKKNAKGETPLHVAAIKGDLERVKLLLEEGSTPNVKDNAGWTPLHEACNHGHQHIVQLLVESGALINVPGGMDNDSPLHDAVQNGQLDCVAALVSHGASLHQRNTQGLTPVDLAVGQLMKEALQTPVTLVPTASLPHMSQLECLSSQNVVLLTTGLSREQKNRVDKCAKMMHGQLVSNYCPRVSHIVTSINSEGMCPRTLKYLQGILTARWIVNLDWVDTCLEFGQKVSEEAFEVPGASTSPDSFAAKKGRLNGEQQLPGLFNGCHFYLQGDFEYPAPSREELSALIKLGGGVLLTREPKEETIVQSARVVPYHAAPDSNVARVAYYTVVSSRDALPQRHGGGLLRVPATWLMDCIAHFELIDLIKR